MGLFKSKQQKEIEKKMLIKRTINTMNKQIEKLEQQKQVFIDAAKRAKQKDLDAQFNLALSGYKMTVQQQRRAQEMLLNFEITAQMKDVTMMTSEFLRGMSSISQEMTKLADAKEFAKIQAQFEQAMVAVETQTDKTVILGFSAISFPFVSFQIRFSSRYERNKQRNDKTC